MMTPFLFASESASSIPSSMTSEAVNSPCTSLFACSMFSVTCMATEFVQSPGCSPTIVTPLLESVHAVVPGDAAVRSPNDEYLTLVAKSLHYLLTCLHAGVEIVGPD